MSEKEAEFYKFKLKIVEVLVDKLVISVILVILALFVDRRLAAYENSLEVKLDQLREVYHFERLLATREISAYENVWKKIVEFRKLTNSYESEKINENIISIIKGANLDLVETIESNEIYIAGDTMRVLENFSEIEIGTLFELWQADENEILSKKAWAVFASATDTVLEKIRGDIYAKKPYVNNLGDNGLE